MIHIIEAEIDKFGAAIGGATSMESAIELFKLGHHDFSTRVSTLLGHMQQIMNADPRLPDKVKDSMAKYLEHFRNARNMECVIMDQGTYEQKKECIHAFLADLSIIKEALHGKQGTLGFGG